MVIIHDHIESQGGARSKKQQGQNKTEQGKSGSGKFVFRVSHIFGHSSVVGARIFPIKCLTHTLNVFPQSFVIDLVGQQQVVQLIGNSAKGRGRQLVAQ
jgi:hypothetical protein